MKRLLKSSILKSLTILLFFQDEKMDIVLIGALAGAVSGAIGYFLAGKFHGNEQGIKIYPLYSVTLFSTIVLAFKTWP